MPLEPQDWNELVGLLKDTEESLSAVSVGDGEKEMEKSRRSLLSFHTTAAMLGLEDFGEGRTRTRKIPDQRGLAGQRGLYRRIGIRRKLSYRPDANFHKRQRRPANRFERDIGNIGTIGDNGTRACRG